MRNGITFDLKGGKLALELFDPPGQSRELGQGVRLDRLDQLLIGAHGDYSTAFKLHSGSGDA
jgi:hypothetical protein